jgi:hypothetical protein
VSLRQDITTRRPWFTSEDKQLVIEVLDDDGREEVDMATPAKNVTGFALAWTLRRNQSAVTNLLNKTTGGGGITITGVFNVSRALNTQRVLVAVTEAEVSAITPAPSATVKGKYWHQLRRTDSGAKGVLLFGDCELLQG